MKKTNKREIRYESIYRASLKVFAEYGYKKTTIGDIANELGVVKSALYFYVADKKELYNNAVAFGLRLWQDKVRESVASESDPGRKFEVMAHKALEYLSEDRNLRNILMRDPALFPLHPSQDPYTDINRDSLEMLKGIITQGIAEKRFRNVDVNTVAPLIFSFYVMLVQKIYMFPEADFDRRMFEAGIDLVLRGLSIR